MSREYSPTLAKRTWDRTLEPVTKNGYMEGASDGQTSVYQKCFDVGYEQGYNYGFQIGLKEARSGAKGTPLTNALLDPRKINCQMCLNVENQQQNIDDLYNIQHQKNMT